MVTERVHIGLPLAKGGLKADNIALLKCDQTLTETTPRAAHDGYANALIAHESYVCILITIVYYMVCSPVPTHRHCTCRRRRRRRRWWRQRKLTGPTLLMMMTLKSTFFGNSKLKSTQGVVVGDNRKSECRVAIQLKAKFEGFLKPAAP